MSLKGLLLLFSRSGVSESLRPHGLQPARLPFAISQSLLKLMPIESVMPSNTTVARVLFHTLGGGPLKAATWHTRQQHLSSGSFHRDDSSFGAGCMGPSAAPIIPQGTWETSGSHTYSLYSIYLFFPSGPF